MITMPRTPKLCSRPGQSKCFKKATKGGRCDEHQPIPFDGAKQRWNAARPAGYNRLRRLVIREAKNRCELCGGPGFQVDHIKSVADGGKWVRENLRLLCEPCHSEKSKEDAANGRRRA